MSHPLKQIKLNIHIAGHRTSWLIKLSPIISLIIGLICLQNDVHIFPNIRILNYITIPKTQAGGISQKSANSTE